MTRASGTTRRARREARRNSFVDRNSTSTVKSDHSEDTGDFFMFSTIPSAAQSPALDKIPPLSSSSSAAHPAVRRLPVRRKEALKGLCKFVTTDDTCQFRRCRFPHSQEELEAALASSSEDSQPAFELESATRAKSQSMEENVKIDHIFSASSVALKHVCAFGHGDNRNYAIGNVTNLTAAPTESVKLVPIVEDDEMGGVKSCGLGYTLWDGPLLPFCFSKKHTTADGVN